MIIIILISLLIFVWLDNIELKEKTAELLDNSTTLTEEQFEIISNKLKQEKRMLIEFETLDEERYGVKSDDDFNCIIFEIIYESFTKSLIIKYKILSENNEYYECIHFHNKVEKLDSYFQVLYSFVENMKDENKKHSTLYYIGNIEINSKLFKQELYNYLQNEHDKKTLAFRVRAC